MPHLGGIVSGRTARSGGIENATEVICIAVDRSAALRAVRRMGGGRAPEGSKPLTEILRPIEARSDFAYFEEIELEEGKYKIEYFTKDGSKQKIEVDPLTGATPAPAGAR